MFDVFSMDIETSYSGVEEARKAVTKLKDEMNKASKLEIKVSEKDLAGAKIHLEALEKSIKEAEKSGGDFSKIFASELRKVQGESQKSASSVRDLDKSLKGLDKTAKSGNGFNAISKSAKLATRDIHQADTQLDKLKNNLQQGVGQTIAFAGIGAITGSAMKLISDVSKLDQITTDISIVSGRSADEMERYQEAALKSADTLGTLGTKYLEASLIYEQQGGEAAYYASELAKSTVVAANISQESTGQMSEYLTATINGFQLLKEKGGEAGTYITDVMAKLGAASGSDLAEIATGLTRTANTAKDAKFEFEEIATMIATVSEVTRRTPETIGNAFKSMLTSFTQLREASDEEVNEFSSKVEKAFQLAGIDGEISIFDNGNLRDASDIFKDISGKWDTMSVESQALVSEAVAGKYQAEVFRAFMNNQERYNDLLETAYNSAGTAAMQQIIYMDSLKAKTEQVGNAWQGISSTILDGDAFGGVLEQVTAAFKTVSNTESSLVAISRLASPLVGIFAASAGKNLGGGLGDVIWGKATSYKNISKELNKIEDISESAKQRKLEEIKIGSEQADIRNKMTDIDATYYENTLAAQERLNEKLGVQGKLLEQAKSKEGFNAIVDEVATRGGAGGLTVDDFSKAREAGEKEAMAQLKKEKEMITSMHSEANQLIKERTLSLDVSQKKSIKSRIESFEITKKEAFTQEEIASIEKRRSDLINKLNKVHENDNQAKVKIKEDLLKLSTEVYEAEKKVGLEIKEQARLAEASYKAKVKQAGLDAGAETVRDSLGNVERSLQSDKDELAMLEAQKRATEKSYQAKEKLQLGIRGAMTAYAGLVPVIASVKSAMDGTISTSDAVTNSMTGLGTAAMTSGNIYLAAAGLVVTSVGQIGKALGWFESQSERTKKSNDSLVRSFMSMDEQVGQKLSLLESVEDGYKNLQKYTGSEILSASTDGLSEEDAKALNERQREYLELSEKIATVAPELVKYYDEQGRAVVDLSQDYDSLLEKMREEQSLVADILSKNASSFASEVAGSIEGAVDKISEANLKLIDLENKRRGLQANKGNESALAKNLADIQEQNSAISESTEVLKQASADVQSKIVKPYYDSNRELQELSKNNKELHTQMSEFIGSQFSSDIITDMLTSGDVDGVERTQKNLDLIIDKVNTLEKKKPGAGESYLESIIGTSDKAKLLIQDAAFNSVEDLESALTIQASRFDDITRSAKDYEEAVNSANKEIQVMKTLSEEERKSRMDGSVAAGVGESTRDIHAKAYAEQQKEIEALQEKLKLTGELTREESKRLHSLEKSNEHYRNLDKNIESRIGQLAKDESSSIESLERDLGSIQDAFNRGSVSAEGFNESLKEIENMEGVVTALNNAKDSVEGLELSQANAMELIDSKPLSDIREELEKLAETAPGIASQLDEIENSRASDSEKRADMLSLLAATSDIALARYGAAAAGMMEADVEVFASWQDINMSKLEAIDEIYDINLSKALTYQEAVEELMTLDETTISKLNEDLLKSSEELQSDIDKQNEEGKEKKGKQEKEKSELVLDANMVAYINTIQTNGDIAKSYQEMSIQSQEAILGIAKAWDKVTGGNSAKKISKSIKAQAKDDIDKQTASLIKEAKDRELKAQKSISKLTKDAGPMNREVAKVFGSTSLNMGGIKTYTRPHKTAEQIAQEARADAAKKEKERDKREAKEKDKKKEKEVKDIELQLNEYIKLDNKLKDVTNSMSDLAVAKDMAYGKDRINLMTREQQLLRQQANLSTQYVKQLEGEQGRLKGSLSSKGFGFNGKDLTNQNAQLKSLEVQVNAIADPEAKEKAKEELQKIQKEIDRYNEVTYNLIPDKKRMQEEARRAISQLARQKVEYDLSLKVDNLALQRDILGVVKDFHEGFDGIDERMQLTQKSAKTNLKEISLLQKQLNDIRSNKDLSSSDRNEMEMATKKQLVSAIGAAQQAQTEMKNLQKEFLDEIGKSITKVSSNYDRIIKKATQMRDLAKDLYGTKNINEIRNYYDIQEKAIESSIDTQQKLMNRLINYRNTLDKSSESWDIANDKVNELADSIENNLTAKMELLSNRWKDFMDGLLAETDRSFGTWGLEGAQSEYEKLIKSQEEYLSGLSKMNTIGAKISEINKEIANTQDPVRAKELTKFRDQELASLMAQDKVSKAEYERAMKLYEIKEKELAMSERENAQRVAQLVRDESGNMTYEFVRGEYSEMSKEIEDLKNAKNDLLEFDESQIKASGAKIFEIIGTYQKQVRDLADKGLSPEEYQKELDKILKQAQSDIDVQQGIIEKWLVSLGSDGANVLEDLFKDGLIDTQSLGMTEQEINDFFAGLESGKINMSDMISGDTTGFADSLGIGSAEAEEKMNAMMEIIIGKNKTITDALSGATSIWTSTAQNNVNTLGKEYEKYIGQADTTLKQYNATTKELNALLTSTNNSSKQVISTVDKQTVAMNKTTGATNKTSASINNLEKMLIGNGSGGLFGSMVQLQNNMNKKLQPSLKTTEKDTYRVRDASYDAARKMNVFGNESNYAYSKTKQFSGQPIKESNNQIKIMGGRTETVYKNFSRMGDNATIAQNKVVNLANELKKLPGAENIIGASRTKMGPIASMASGGYTGTWNNSTGNQEGRIALLHEKELVLNKDDTSNLLRAVSLQRKMVNSLGSRPSQAQNITKNQSINEKYITNNSEKVIQSAPVINASFPDVRDSRQIENAFEGLFAKATTYIGKNK